LRARFASFFSRLASFFAFLRALRSARPSRREPDELLLLGEPWRRFCAGAGAAAPPAPPPAA
jgi:hypothetical protein